MRHKSNGEPSADDEKKNGKNHHETKIGKGTIINISILLLFSCYSHDHGHGPLCITLHVEKLLIDVELDMSKSPAAHFKYYDIDDQLISIIKCYRSADFGH